jgi:hypothetical protein
MLHGLHGVYNLIEVISSWTEQKLRSILKCDWLAVVKLYVTWLFRCKSTWWIIICSNLVAEIVCNIVRKRKYKLPSSNQSILPYLYNWSLRCLWRGVASQERVGCPRYISLKPNSLWTIEATWVYYMLNNQLTLQKGFMGV